MSFSRTCLTAGLCIMLAACGTSRTERTLSGGALGAGVGAGAAALTGGSPWAGAAIGGAAGAVTGYATRPDQINLDR